MTASSRPEVQYVKEQRMSVVMYGGVSLAIYIGGVAKEMLAIVRASGRAMNDLTHAALGPEELDGVEKIYRKLAQWDGTPGTKPLDMKDDAPLLTRYVIDVISGTSAGGINGVFLARALAESSTLDSISRLWIEEGDLGKLLNDGKSLEGLTGLVQQNPPVSLLNGERMYRILLNAFGQMVPGASKVDAGDRIDLYVTTTDVRGEVVRLELANGFATEKRYRQAFHFVHEPAAERNDFADDRKARLAFAARCTSSFPFAFEPFTWADAARLSGVEDAGWSSDLLYYSGDYAKRPLCDGGYLDNKPFSYVVDEMAKRHSDLPAARTLFFVEPDPASLDEASLRKVQTTKPNAVENALSALVSLPGYETIREDIERVLARNGQVDMIQHLTTEMETYLAEHPVRRDRDDVAKRHGVAYVAYHRIKVESVEKWFSELVCSAASLGEAKIEQIVRELVRRWVNDAYKKGRGDSQLLLDLDFAYRMRKIAFLLRRANKEAPHLVTELKALYDSVYRLQRKARTDIGGGAGQLFSAMDGQLRKVADTSDPQLRAVALEGLYTSLQQQATPAGGGARLDMLDHYIESEMRSGMKSIAHGLKDLLGRPGAEKLRADAEAFEEYDMVLFPLMAEGGIGEPVHVDVVRISPLDVKAGGGVKKLAGTKLGHFGAFLEADWRMNDILWGRLDGSEMIIRQMLTGQDEVVIAPVVAKAHEAIIDDLCKVLEDRITANQSASASARQATLQQQRQNAQAAVAAAKLEDKGAMVTYFAQGNGFDLGIDRERQANNAARAGRIIEKLLSGIAEEKKVTFPRAISSVLYFIWGLVQISIPQSIPRLLWSHIGKVAFLLFAILALGGSLFHAPEVRSLGLTGLVVVVVIAVISSALANWFQERLSIYWSALFHSVAALIILATLFVIAVTSKPATNVAWAPAFFQRAWTATAAWFALVEKAVPKPFVFVVEGGVLTVAIALSTAAVSLRRRRPPKV